MPSGIACSLRSGEKNNHAANWHNYVSNSQGPSRQKRWQGFSQRLRCRGGDLSTAAKPLLERSCLRVAPTNTFLPRAKANCSLFPGLEVSLLQRVIFYSY